MKNIIITNLLFSLNFLILTIIIKSIQKINDILKHCTIGQIENEEISIDIHQNIYTLYTVGNLISSNYLEKPNN